VGLPRALKEDRQAEGKPAPSFEKGTVAEIRVARDTLVLAGGGPSPVTSIAPGSEVVAVPVAGTTFMSGDSLITMEASYFLDFETYRAWQLPGLATGDEPLPVEDPSRINSAGVEHAPVPLKGGTVLYFAARMRPPTVPGEPWIGAQRVGLQAPEAPGGIFERSYRSALAEDGWSSPELVEFADTEEFLVVRVTWVDEEETSCLLTIQEADEPTWVGRASRSSDRAPWGPVERIEALGQEEAADAVYLAGSRSKIALVSKGIGFDNGDIFLYDPQQPDGIEGPVPLVTTVNTTGNEWAPRVGANNELLFCRGDAQLVLRQGGVQPLRLPLPHRALITEANGTRDGSWLFFCLPAFTPIELDQNIYVAPLDADFQLGEAVPVDEWRPEAEE
jgi:hypothetical protein